MTKTQPSRLFVVMSVFRPDPGHLAAQITSIAHQDAVTPQLVAVIADTRSGALVQQTADRAGIAVHLVPSDIALDEVLRQIDDAGLGDDDCLIALSDQDAIWHPDRLARGVAAL